MGLISKSIHKRTTNRLVAPTRVVTTLSSAQIASIARSVCEAFEPRRGILSKGERMWFSTSGDDRFVVFYGPPAKSEPDKVTPIWRFDISIVADPSEPGRRVAALELMTWKTRDGSLVNKAEFEATREMVLDGIRSTDRTARVLDATSS